MLDPGKSSNAAASPDLIRTINESAVGWEFEADNKQAFQFIDEGRPLWQLGFEHLGLVAFDPDSVDWWSAND